MNDDNRSSASGIAAGLPPVPPIDAERDERDIRVVEPTAMQVFFAWEKLRLTYNAALALLVILMCGPAIIFMVETVAISALAANLMFCAGPVGECYLFWWGMPNKAARWILFVLGMLVSIGITILACQEAMGHMGWN